MSISPLAIFDPAAPLMAAPVMARAGAQLIGDRLVWDYCPAWPMPLDARLDYIPTPAEIGALRGAMARRPAQATTDLRRGTPDLLTNFVRLHRKPDRIRDFAHEWGALGICGHGLRMSHTLEERDGFSTCSRGMGFGCRWEPVAGWQRWSRGVAALLNIAVAIERGEAGSRDDWSAAYPDGRWPYYPTGVHQGLEGARRLLTDRVHCWLDDAAVKVGLTWDGDRADIMLYSARASTGRDSTLMGSIGLALLTTIARADGLAICAACKTPFLLSRRGGSGKRRYCETCGRAAADRDAHRDAYARRKVAAPIRQAAASNGSEP